MSPSYDDMGVSCPEHLCKVPNGLTSECKSEIGSETVAEALDGGKRVELPNGCPASTLCSCDVPDLLDMAMPIRFLHVRSPNKVSTSDSNYSEGDGDDKGKCAPKKVLVGSATCMPSDENKICGGTFAIRGPDMGRDLVGVVRKSVTMSVHMLGTSSSIVPVNSVSNKTRDRVPDKWIPKTRNTDLMVPRCDSSCTLA